MSDVLRTAPGYADNFKFSEDGRVFNSKTGRWLNPTLEAPRKRGEKKGYYRLNIRNSDGKVVTQYLHILMCLAFHGIKPQGVRITVDHIDRDHTNNKASNLKWCEQAENNNNRGPRTKKALPLSN